MRDAQIKSLRDWVLRRRTLLAAPTSTPPSRPAVRTPVTPANVAAPIAGGAFPAASVPLPIVTAVPVLALAPEPVPVPVTVAVAEPRVETGNHKISGLPASFRTRVLVIASDRRFRAVAATLLTQRGYAVSVGGRGEDVAELAVREHADVVIIDASASLTVAAREAARLGSLRPRVEVVAVSDGSGHGLATLPLLPKWSSFDEVFEAIDRVRPDGSRAGVTRVAP
jgi:CheY-like chemotaxis protein